MHRHVSMALLLVAAGCQSADRTTSDNSGLGPTASRASGQRVVGRAHLIAPIKSAHVRITRLISKDTVDVVAEDKTDDEGTFDIVLPQPADGDLLIEILGDRGGTTIEPVTGVSPITLSESDVLMTLAIGTHIGDETNIVVNPVSTLVAARSLAEFRGGASLAKAFQKNNDLFSAHLNSATPWLSSPVDLLAAEAPGLSSGVIYSLAVVGLSTHALELGTRASVTDVSVVNSLVVLRALVADISSTTDTIFDGLRDGAPLNITGNVFIDQETTRLSLAKSIEAFLDSAANNTGLTKRDVTAIAAAIRQDVSELYPAALAPHEKPDTGQSGAPPLIVITAPQPSKTLGTTDHIVGYAEDADGIASLTVLLDGVDAAVQTDNSNPGKWTFDFVPALASGPHLLEVEATDVNNNLAKKQVQFSFDSQPPVIALVDCASPDDRARTASVSLSGATYLDDATAMSCTEGDLQSGSQYVYSFADLYEEGTRVTRVRLSVTDQSTLASVAYRVKVNGVEVKTPRPLPTAGAPATHAVAINLDTLDLEATAIRAGDTMTVEVIAVDQNDNKSTRELSFHLGLLPTPLHVSSTTPDSSVSLQGHTFALGNVAQIFDYDNVYDPSKTQCGYLFCKVNKIPFVHLARFVATNASARPITLSRDWAAASAGTLELRRWLYRTYYFSTQAFPRNQNSPCSEITEVAASGTFYYGTAAADYSTQTCYSLNNDFLYGKRAQQLTFTPEWRVFELPSGSELTGTQVTLAPGKQYAVVLGVKDLSIPWTTPNLAAGWPADPNGTFWNNYMYGRETNTRYPLSWYETETPTQIGGFFKFNRFVVHSNGTTHRLWGGADGYYASASFDSLSSPGTRVRTIYVPSTNMNHLMSTVVLERGIELAGSLKWRVPISMSAADPGFVGTGNHQPTAAIASYFDQPAGVTTCPWTNPLCNVDLSAW